MAWRVRRIKSKIMQAMSTPYPLESMKRKGKALTPKNVLKREQARAQREKLVARLEIQLRAAKLPKWMREVAFDKTGRRLDLAWVRNGWAPLAVEIHGGVWSNGRHVRGQGFINDRAKMNDARLAGWLVLEVCDEHIESGQAIEWIRRALQA